MATGQGIYTTVNDVKNWYKQKYKGQNVFDSAISAAEQQASAATAQTFLNAASQEEAARRQFDQYVTNAYKSSLSQRSDILNSNLLSGTKGALLTDVDVALSDAYNSYLQTLQNNVGTVGETAAKQYATIDKNVASVKEEADELLTAEAKNITKGIDYAFDYLQAVGKYAEQQEGGLEALYNNPDWQKYIKKYTEEGSDEPLYRMYTREELSTPRIDIPTGKQVGLYDSLGNLTDSGKDFFDQMFNFNWTGYDTLKDMQSYGAFVADKDKDFYEWLQGPNMYSDTSDAYERNVNMGLLREAVGLDAGDLTYTRKDVRTKVGYDSAALFSALSGNSVSREEALNFAKAFKNTDTKDPLDLSNIVTKASVNSWSDEKYNALKKYAAETGIDTSKLNKFNETYKTKQEILQKLQQEQQDVISKYTRRSRRGVSVSSLKNRAKFDKDYIRIQKDIDAIEDVLYKDFKRMFSELVDFNI